MALLSNMVTSVLEADDSPIRFERFCLDIYFQAEGVELVPTSRTRDFGRDGRTVSLAGTELETVLCATLDREIDRKVEADIRRLAQTTQNTFFLHNIVQKHFLQEYNPSNLLKGNHKAFCNDVQ